jgi:hypothetical protein
MLKGVMLEVWMGGNTDIYKKRQDLEFWVYNKPSKQVKECLLILLKKVLKENSSSTKDTKDFSKVREGLYGFVKMELEYGDLAELGQIVDIWTTYATPWLVRGQEFTVQVW